MRVYIAGPMSGLPNFNYPAFYKAAERLTEMGHTPINPARTEDREGCSTWLDFMRAALRDISRADGVALLPGWRESSGASLENDTALRLGFSVKPLAYWLVCSTPADHLTCPACDTTHCEACGIGNPADGRLHHEPWHCADCKLGECSDCRAEVGL